MKFEEIKINEIYEVWGDEHKVVHKHYDSRTVFTIELDSDEPYGFDEGQLCLFSPIALPETGLLVSKAGSIVYRTGERSGYGFTPPGFISDRVFIDEDRRIEFHPNHWKKATLEDEEKFEKLLIQEAAKHGLVDGVEFESAFSGRKYVVNTKDTRFDDTGFTMGIGYVFHNGKWATPIKNEKQDELDSTIEKLFKLGEELGIEVLLTLDNKEK